MTFLDEFMKLSVNSESPKSYWLFSGLCVISAIVKRNVWIQRPTWKTYPNIFVFLVGDSGLRKGAPISAAKELAIAVNNTRTISGRSSLQGIISHLGMAYTTKEGEVIDKAYGFICSSEFSSSIVRDPDSLTILTDLFDSCFHDKWVDLLRGGRVELHEPSITLLAGINPPHFEDFISPTALHGGFVARLLLVFENEKACINPAIRRLQKDAEIDTTSLINKLKVISKLEGEMEFADEDAYFAYESWYNEFENARKNKKVKDKTGSINRVGENVLKVAILLSLSRQPDLIITKEDIDSSLSICLSSLSNVNKTTTGQGKADYAYQTRLVISELFNAPNNEMTRKKLLVRNMGDLDSIDLDRVINNLIESGGATQERRGIEIYYKLTKVAVDFMKGN